MISVVIPVFNRRENLALCLKALGNQLDAPEFEIIVVDDGSTDGVREWLSHNYDTSGVFRGDSRSSIGYLSGGPNKGFRGGRARNIGAFNSNGDRLVFIDSDVIANQFLIHNYAVAIEAQPKAIIVGRYYFMPRIQFAHHHEILWQSQDYDGLMKRVDDLGLTWDKPEGAVKYGGDLGGRPPHDFYDDTTHTVKGAALGGLSGNISYPRDLFERVGGFDEKIVGHGGEDAMLGLTVDDKEKPDWLFYAPLAAFHLWHERDQKRNQREVDANIEYIDRTFGIGRYAGAKKWSDSMDKSNPGHYHRHQGAVAVKTPSDGTVWLLRTDHMTRLGVTTQDWLSRMGFIPLDVKTISREELDKYVPHGVTREMASLEDLKVESTNEQR